MLHHHVLALVALYCNNKDLFNLSQTTSKLHDACFFVSAVTLHKESPVQQLSYTYSGLHKVTLQDLDVIRQLVEVKHLQSPPSSTSLNVLHSVEELDIAGLQTTDTQDIRVLLKNVKSLKRLNASGLVTTVGALGTLVKSLPPCLCELDLSRVQQSGFVTFTSLPPKLRRINLSGLSLNKAECLSLAAALRGCKSLEEFYEPCCTSECDTPILQLHQEMARATSAMRTIVTRKPTYSRNPGLVELITKSHHKLEHVHLCIQDSIDWFFATVAACAPRYPVLQDVIIRGPVAGQSLLHLSIFLGKTRVLESLTIMHHNAVFDEGLGHVLAGVPLLVKLRLEGGFNPRSWECLADHIGVLTKLRTLEIRSHTRVHNSVYDRLQAVLLPDCQLQVYDYDFSCDEHLDYDLDFDLD